MRLLRNDARPCEDDTTLSSYGLNLTNDGRVFFTSREGLVLSDTNEKLDAYQWNGGLEVGKISTGRSSFDSRFYSVSADGRDAYFFTRDVLVPTDENGGAVKIYDARSEGGYPQSAVTASLRRLRRVSRPGNAAAGAPNINSITGAGTSRPGQSRRSPSARRASSRSTASA